MSNQRPGKWKRATMPSGMNDMVLRNFFRTAKEELEANGNEDAAYYFEQCVDWINDGKSIMTDDRKKICTILGL